MIVMMRRHDKLKALDINARFAEAARRTLIPTRPLYKAFVEGRHSQFQSRRIFCYRERVMEELIRFLAIDLKDRRNAEDFWPLIEYPLGSILGNFYADIQRSSIDFVLSDQTIDHLKTVVSQRRSIVRPQLIEPE
jgi:hypothetical protein